VEHQTNDLSKTEEKVVSMMVFKRSGIIRYQSIISLLGCFLISLPAFDSVAAPDDLVVESGKVEFLAIGKPSFLKVKGQGAAPHGSLSLQDGKAQGSFTFELASLDTGIDLRNEHMKYKYLEISKYPKATVRFQDVPINKQGKQTIPATLELHGIVKKIDLEAEMKPNGEAKTATASFKIKLTDFEIAIPEHLGIRIADEVTVNIEAKLK
jgi:polyisoprenoid-binding protein YceI